MTGSQAGHGHGMDARSLAKLYSVDGPFVTTYLNTRGDTEDARTQLETRWKNIVRDLRNTGVDETTIGALCQARGDHTSGGTRVLVAAHGTAHLATSLPQPPPPQDVEDPAAHVATTAPDFADVGLTTQHEAPLDELLLRAAWGTGADVRFVTGGVGESPNDGVGALLRYAD